MKILAIETATAVCGVAAIEDGQILAEQCIEAQQIHSEKIIGLIDQTLKVTSSHMNAFDALAVSIGPGSFTGLRIGLSTAKGLAYALDRQMTAVSTLEALALHALRQQLVREDETVLSMIDARRDEVYAACYRITNGRPRVKISPYALQMTALAHLIEDEKKITLMGDGVEKFEQFLMNTHTHDRLRFIIPTRDQRVCSAAAVGLLGEQQCQRGIYADIASLEPMYGKDFYTTMKQPAVQA